MTLDRSGKRLYADRQSVNPEVMIKMEQEKILRINELAKKKKEVGLTDEEMRERSALYAQYIKEFREQTEATLKRVRVEQEDGSYKPLVKKERKLN